MLGTDQQYLGAWNDYRIVWLGTEKADDAATYSFTRDSEPIQPSSLTCTITTSFRTLAFRCAASESLEDFSGLHWPAQPVAREEQTKKESTRRSHF